MEIALPDKLHPGSFGAIQRQGVEVDQFFLKEAFLTRLLSVMAKAGDRIEVFNSHIHTHYSKGIFSAIFSPPSCQINNKQKHGRTV